MTCCSNYEAIGWIIPDHTQEVVQVQMMMMGEMGDGDG
jgi:hypothetical protein